MGEEVFPVQEAANYQIGNSYAKVYTEYARQAEDEPDGVLRGLLASKADSAFAATLRAFRQVISHSTNEVLRSEERRGGQGCRTRWSPDH